MPLAQASPKTPVTGVSLDLPFMRSQARGTEGATCADTTNLCCDFACTPVSTRGSVHDYLRPLTDAPSPPSVTATGVPPVRMPRGAPQLPGKPRAATLSATLSHESNEADWNVGGPSTCLMS